MSIFFYRECDSYLEAWNDSNSILQITYNVRSNRITIILIDM